MGTCRAFKNREQGVRLFAPTRRAEPQLGQVPSANWQLPSQHKQRFLLTFSQFEKSQKTAFHRVFAELW
jgi:hypothetical protein